MNAINRDEGGPSKSQEAQEFKSSELDERMFPISIDDYQELHVKIGERKSLAKEVTYLKRMNKKQDEDIKRRDEDIEKLTKEQERLLDDRKGLLKGKVEKEMELKYLKKDFKKSKILGVVFTFFVGISCSILANDIANNQSLSSYGVLFALAALVVFIVSIPWRLGK